MEELSTNAWPSLQAMRYDGWLLGFADGYTRRANSISPVYPSTINILEKIRCCEEIYASRGLDTIFKMTSVAQPENLDTVLAELGYSEEALTAVCVVELGSVTTPASDRLSIETELTDGWLDAFCRLSHLDDHYVPVLAHMLRNIIPARAFFALEQNAQTVSTGLAVLERGYVGLFNIVSDTHFRNQGLGMQIVLHMLQWGKASGAKYAYLGVMHSNAPAQHLYSKLGFREVYSYWYRIKRRT